MSRRKAREPGAYPGLLAALMAAVRPNSAARSSGSTLRDPVFCGRPCLVDGCERPGRKQEAVCLALRPVVQAETGHRAVRRRGRPRMAPAVGVAACQFPGCENAGQALGRCEGDYTRYLRDGRPGISDWTAAVPPEPLAACLVIACGLWAQPGALFCHAHVPVWRLHGRPDPVGFAAGYGDEAKLARDRISLRELPAQLRLEWQYAFLARSHAGRQKVNPVEASGPSASPPPPA